MKQIFFVIPASLLLLTGCQQNTQPSPSEPSMTQSAVQDDAAFESSSSTESAANSTGISSSNVQPSKEISLKNNSLQLPVNTASQEALGTYEEQLKKYCAAKAEEDAVDVEQDILESDYLTGKIDSQAFQAQKTELKNLEDVLESQTNQKKLALHQVMPQKNLPNGSIEELVNRFKQLEAAEEELDGKEEKLENDYRLSKLSREDFISQQTELLIQKEQNDYEKDLVEEALELSGWDD